jgi:hypothetical protein
MPESGLKAVISTENRLLLWSIPGKLPSEQFLAGWNYGKCGPGFSRIAH